MTLETYPISKIKPHRSHAARTWAADAVAQAQTLAMQGKDEAVVVRRDKLESARKAIHSYVKNHNLPFVTHTALSNDKQALYFWLTKK